MLLKCCREILVVRVPVAARDVMCKVCSRTLRRQRHKCEDKTQKPLRKQYGAVQCLH